MTASDIISNILISMDEVLSNEDLRSLRDCLYRSMYGLTIVEETTELSTKNIEGNDAMIKKFVFSRKIEGLSNETLIQYKRETERFFEFIGKHYSEVKSDDINYYLSYLMSKHLSVNTIDNSRKFIKPFFKWLYENEYIRKDVFLHTRPIKRVEKQKEFLTNEEVTKVRDASQGDVRSLALIDFLLSTGVRVSECSNLKISDVDFLKGEVNIYATKTKEWRKVYLDSNALKHLQDYLNTRIDTSPYLFVNIRKSPRGILRNMSNVSIEDIVHRCCNKANILNKHCTVHLFRKTLATRLYKRGMDITVIAKILGHKNVTTTEKYYLTICEQDIKYQYMRCA